MEQAVTHVTTVHPRYDTRIFYKECSSLAANGYRVRLVVADGLGAETRNGVSIVDVGVASGGRIGRMLVSVWRAFRAALATKPECVHLHDPELLVTVPVFRALGVRVFYDMHENVPKQILTKVWLPVQMRWGMSKGVQLIERLVLRGVPVVMAEKSYAHDYPWLRNVSVVQNFPVLPDVQESSEGPFDVFTVGYIGGVTRERGVLAVLDAVAELRSAGRVIEFECLGPVSSNVAECEAFDKAIADGWLRAPGRVDGAVGLKRISRCHVGVAVLTPLPNYVESWPTKMFEYMALGLPVIASDFPMYRGVVDAEACGLLAKPERHQEIVDALVFMMDNPEDAKSMGVRGRDAALHRFSWANEESKLLRFYSELSPR